MGMIARPRVAAVAAALALVGTGAGCATSAATGPLVPETPVLASRCRAGASQNSVLVTEWSSAEKANVEAMLRTGAIAVAFSGCELRPLPECRLPGHYTWNRTTLSSDRVEIRSDAELFAKLPLGAVALGGELRKSGELAVQTTVSGQARLVGMDASQVSADQRCADATHLINAMSIGAFVLTAGGTHRASASVGAPIVGEARGSLAESAKIVRAAGRAEACAGATDQAPAADCASPLQVFLAPIPGRAEPEGPPGTVRVDFVSASADQRWDVYIDDHAACTTPCSGWVDPSRPVALRTREDRPQKLSVARLVTGAGPLQVAAQPRKDGQFVTAVTFTSLGGLAAITGITLLGVGCASDDRAGMCRAGGITLAAGIPVTLVSIWLLVKSFPSVRVRPLFGNDGPILSVTPLGIAGAF